MERPHRFLFLKRERCLYRGLLSHSENVFIFYESTKCDIIQAIKDQIRIKPTLALSIGGLNVELHCNRGKEQVIIKTELLIFIKCRIRLLNV